MGRLRLRSRASIGGESGSLLDAVTDLTATLELDGTVTVDATDAASAPDGYRLYRQEVDADGNRIGSRVLLDTIAHGDWPYLDFVPEDAEAALIANLGGYGAGNVIRDWDILSESTSSVDALPDRSGEGGEDLTASATLAKIGADATNFAARTTIDPKSMTTGADAALDLGASDEKTIFVIGKAPTGSAGYAWVVQSPGATDAFQGLRTDGGTQKMFSDQGLALDPSIALNTPQVFMIRNDGRGIGASNANCTKPTQSYGITGRSVIYVNATAFGATRELTVGRIDSFGSSYGTFDFQKCLVLDRAATAADIEKVTAYAIAHRGVSAPSLNDKIHFVGNSRTAGSGASDTAHNYPSRVMAAIGAGVDWDNVGVGSRTAGAIDTCAPYDFLWDVDERRDNNVMVLWEGCNGIITGASAAAIYASLKSTADAYRALGGKVVICTETTYQDCVGGDETKRLALNTLIRDNYLTFADGLVDLAADSGLDYFTTPANFADTIHYNDDGYQLIADLIEPVVSGLLA